MGGEGFAYQGLRDVHIDHCWVMIGGRKAYHIQKKTGDVCLVSNREVWKRGEFDPDYPLSLVLLGNVVPEFQTAVTAATRDHLLCDIVVCYLQRLSPRARQS